MKRSLMAGVLLLGVMAGNAAATEAVDLELVLLADASRSIDDAEIRFQRQGYASAITHPEVMAAIAAGPYRRVAITYVEWGDAAWQDVVVPWTVIDGAGSARAFADALLAAPRRAGGGNAIGSAIAAAHALLDGNDIEGTRRVIDFSGDSANSFSGIPVAPARERALAAGIVINGLAVLCLTCSGPPVTYDLAEAFRNTIIGGPGSFVITADATARFTDSVRRKLLLELSGTAFPARTARLAGAVAP